MMTEMEVLPGCEWVGRDLGKGKKLIALDCARLILMIYGISDEDVYS